MSISTEAIPVTGEKSHFIISTKDKDFTLTARIIYEIPLTDGTKIIKNSENFSLTVSSAFLDGFISSDNVSNVDSILADADGAYYLNVVRKEAAASAGNPEKDFSVKLINDITSKEVLAAQKATDGKFALPAAITKNTGVYRAIFSGNDGISGELIFSVRAGELSQIELSPISTAIVKDSETLVTLSLFDKSRHSVDSDLFSVELRAE